MVGAWRYLTTRAPLWGGLRCWRCGCAARRYDPCCRCCHYTPIHCRHYHRCHWSVLWGRRWVASRGCSGRGCPVWRVCRGRALPALSWVGAASATSPAAPSASKRGGPRVQTAACVSAAGGGRSGLRCGACGACPESDSHPPGCTSAPLGIVAWVGAELEPIPHLPPFIGAAMRAPHQGLVGVPCLHCMPRRVAATPTNIDSGTHTHPPPPTDVHAAVGRGCGCCWLIAASAAACAAACTAASMAAACRHVRKQTRQAGTLSAAAWNDDHWAPAPR